MEAREARAICQWLGWSAGSPEAARLLSDPLRVLLAHIDTLPPHLQAPFAAVTTPQQRGASARFRTRWRNWAQQTRPEELSIEQARQRDPLSYKDIVGEQSGRRSIPQDQPASDLSDSNAVTRPPDVAAKPRFAALVRDFDEQDRLQLLARQQQHRMETTAEVEEEEEEEEGSDDGGMAANAHESGSTAREQTTGSLQREAEADFVNEVLAGFVRGSSRLPAAMYQCDYDDRWDDDESHHDRRSLQAEITTGRGALDGLRGGRNPGIDSEEAWFDEEEPS